MGDIWFWISKDLAEVVEIIVIAAGLFLFMVAYYFGCDLLNKLRKKKEEEKC